VCINIKKGKKPTLPTGHVLFLTVVFGIGGLIGSLVGGIIMDQYGISSLYLWMGLLAAVGTVSFFFYKQVVMKEEEVTMNRVAIKG
jgi:predicted MFS family arabinose efflux permease